MNRRQPKPGPGRDFRALVAERPQQHLVLPPAPEPEEAFEAPPEPEIEDVELRVRRAPDGRLYALLVASVALRDAGTVRRLAGRLHDAADALDGKGARR